MDATFFICIFYLPLLMCVKPRSVCPQRVLVLWNTSMSCASFSMLFAWTWAYVTLDDDFRLAVLYMFCMTKPVEFIDSVLLVWRRHKFPAPVHYIHHQMTSIVCWMCVYCRYLPGEPYAVMNLVVHVVMYAYFAIATNLSSRRVPRCIKLTITFMQVSQMFAGLAWALYCVYTDPTDTLAMVFVVLYSLFAWLFVPLLY